jgi:hypothetical protein
MYTLLAYSNDRFRFCWSHDTKDPAVREGIRWLKRGNRMGKIMVYHGDYLIFQR